VSGSIEDIIEMRPKQAIILTHNNVIVVYSFRGLILHTFKYIGVDSSYRYSAFEDGL
jgi:hypothetical protein